MHRIHVNGEPRTLERPTSVESLVASLVADARDGVAVALNGEIVRRTRWTETEVQDGDAVEIVRAVQGG